MMSKDTIDFYVQHSKQLKVIREKHAKYIAGAGGIDKISLEKIDEMRKEIAAFIAKFQQESKALYLENKRTVGKRYDN